MDHDHADQPGGEVQRDSDTNKIDIAVAADLIDENLGLVAERRGEASARSDAFPGLAQVFDTSGSRLLRRNGHANEFVARRPRTRRPC